MSSNGGSDTTPPEPTSGGALDAAERRRRAQDEIARLDARQLAERACRDAFAAGVEAGVAAEYAKKTSVRVDQMGVALDVLSLRFEKDAMARADRDAALMVELGRINTHLGMVKAEQRKARASRPDTDPHVVRILDLHVEDMMIDTRTRALSLQRRADAWAALRTAIGDVWSGASAATRVAVKVGLPPIVVALAALVAARMGGCF